jgi:1-acyl-sn-glycerol-3-phosphate acyltransferase
METDPQLETGGTREKRKENPVLSFLSKTVLKPIDQMLVGLLDVVHQSGLGDSIQYPHYLNTDAFWYSVMNQLFNFEVLGSENIPPQGTGAVVILNHSGFLDPFIMGVSVAHYSRRKVFISGKGEIFKTPLANAYFRWIYGFPINRGEHDEEAHNFALGNLRKGELVGMFPEGTFNNGGLNFLPARSGAIRLAIEANVPILPLGVSGSDRIMGKGMKLPNLNARLVTKFGELIPVHEKFKGMVPDKETMRVEMDTVMEKIKELLVY